MKEFRSGASRVLIATELIPLQFGISCVFLVINYDFPSDRETYVHRVGRGGRFGRKGVVISFATAEDLQALRDVEQSYHTQINEMPLNVVCVQILRS